MMPLLVCQLPGIERITLVCSLINSSGAIGLVLFICVTFNRGLDYPGNYSSIVQNLKLVDIQNSAAKIVKPQNLTWLIVGDRQKIEAGIRELNLGPVKILDADGKEIK